MKPVILINPFTVPVEEEKKFLTFWRRADAYMQAQTGFIETKLHKCLDDLPNLPKPTFRFINVALWESAEAFQKAVSTPEFKECAKDVLPYSAGPGLYEVMMS